MEGQRFGKLLVKERVLISKSHKNGPQYLCLCDCGKEIVRLGIYIRNAKNPSCGNTVNCDRKDALYKHAYRHRVIYPNKKRGFYGDISLEHFKSIVSSPCFYCGHVGYTTIEDDISDEVIKINGLDRIDSSISYCKSNVVSACFECNLAKLDLPQKFFLERVRKIVDRRQLRVEPDFSLSDGIVWAVDK